MSDHRQLNRILIIKIGAIGDVVMCLPMVNYLRRKNPNADITWICGEIVAPIVKATGLATRVITVNETELFKKGKLRAAAAVGGIWSRLTLKHYDFVVTGHSDVRYRLISIPARASKKVYFKPELNRSHVVQYLGLVKDKPSMDDAEFPRIQASLAFDLEKQLLPGKTVVALAPGGTKNALRDSALKRWPLDNYVRLAKEMLARNYQVILTGNEGDHWVSDSFPDEVTNFISKTDLTGLIKLYEKCDVLITHDSGPMHLAALAHIPVYGIFGPTHPDSFFPQFRRDSRIFWGGEDMACRPCYDGREFADCARNMCMEKITPNQVLTAAEELLSQ